MESDNGKTDERENSVECAGNATDVEFIAKPATTDHDEAGEGVWWSDQALRDADGKAKALVQDQGQEVCQSVGDGGNGAENLSVG